MILIFSKAYPNGTNSTSGDSNYLVVGQLSAIAAIGGINITTGITINFSSLKGLESFIIDYAQNISYGTFAAQLEYPARYLFLFEFIWLA